MFDIAIDFFKLYSGSGLMMTLFLVSLCYLWVTEENKHIKYVLVYTSLLILVIFFFPLFSWIFTKYADSEIYYRILWLLPIGITIAYAMVRVVRRTDGVKKWLCFGGCILLLVLSGRYVYANEHFSVAENSSHMPQEVVDICDYIIVPGREVRAAFPAAFLPYVRQYTGLVCMPYGRELFMENSEYYNSNKIYELLENDVLDVKSLAEELRQQECHYVIIKENQEKNGDLQDFEWLKLTQIEGYEIFVDKNNNPR